MQPHQERVIAEKDALDEKIGKLGYFVKSSPIFKTLPVAEQLRLTKQLSVMGEYSIILKDRIAAF